MATSPPLTGSQLGLVSPTRANHDATTPQPHSPAIHPAPPSDDPKVAELQVMFPTVDIAVIELILETSGGSQDRAIEQLLSMTDPEFKPDELASARREEESQLDLDAQFARSLQMQDEQEARAVQSAERTQPGQLPYQARVRRARPAPQQQQDAFYDPTGGRAAEGYYNPAGTQRGDNPPGMLGMEDKLNQYAEMGKQTFSTLLGRAKAKYADYQAQQATAREREEQSPDGRWSQGGTSTARRGSGGYGPPGGSRGGAQNTQRGGLWGDNASYSERSETSSFSESGYDHDATPQPIPTSHDAPLRKSPARWTPSDTYDDPLPPPKPITSQTQTPVNRIGGRSSPGVGSPDKGTSAGKIDPAKLGILPKKRVDLLSTSPNASTPTPATRHDTAADDDDEDPNPALPSAPQSLVSKIPSTPPADNRYKLEDSDDELEYTRNPFDER